MQTMREKRRKKSYRITQMQFLALVFAIALFLFACGSFSAAWLSKNRKVQKNNIAMSLTTTLLDPFTSEDEEYILIGTDESLFNADEAANLLPGSVLTFDIGILNSSDHDVLVKHIGLEKPKVWLTTDGGYNKASTAYDENPVKKTVDGSDEYFYLGTQMTVKVDSYSTYTAAEVSGSAVSLAGGTLTTTSSSGVRLLADTLESEALILLNGLGTDGEGLIVETGEAVVFHLSLTFENDGDQSGYMDFGSETLGGCCARRIYISASDYQTED